MSYHPDHSHRYNYLMNKKDKALMWGTFGAVTLAGTPVIANIILSYGKQYKIDQAQENINKLKLQQASSKSDTVFMVPANEKNSHVIGEYGQIQLLAQENIETLTRTTYTELLKPLYQEHQNALKKEMDGTVVGVCIGVGLVSSFVANSIFAALGGNALYEKSGMALNKLFSKRKKNKNLDI